VSKEDISQGDGVIVDKLLEMSAKIPNKMAYGFIQSEASLSPLSYKELHEKVSFAAANISENCNDNERVILLFDTSLEFVVYFLGCLKAGVIAVPYVVPSNKAIQENLDAIIRDTESRLIISTEKILSRLAVNDDGYRYELVAARGRNVTSYIGCVAVEQMKEVQEKSYPVIDCDKIAFIQYTSGSTSQPKGVMVSHGNLNANLQMIVDGFSFDSNMVMLTWLPHYHDMGLIGSILAPLFIGGSCYMMPPGLFVRRPVLWLKLIDRYQATVTGGPSFAFDHCIDRIQAHQYEGVDLSSLTTLFCGSEPISSSTMIKFFDKSKLENNQAVKPADDASSSSSQHLVACGYPRKGAIIKIVTPETCCECPEGNIGEIWISGEHIAQGYWNQSELTRETFQAQIKSNGVEDNQTYLRTGDLGFMSQGQLYITGRLKDVVILEGRNLYPQDIEKSVISSYDDAVVNRCVAFSVEVDSRDQLVVVTEFSKKYLESLGYQLGQVKNTRLEDDVDQQFDQHRGQLYQKIQASIAANHGVTAHKVLVSARGSIPVTSSGKVKRSLCKQMYISKQGLGEVLA